MRARDYPIPPTPPSRECRQQHSDFLEAHVEAWTVTTDGVLLAGLARHFIRIHPVDPDNPQPDEDPNRGVLMIRNRPPGKRVEFPAKEIVDAGFLELVSYGIRRAEDPLIEDSLRVVDAILKVETPFGPCWRRYNHDGYGQRDGGGPYEGWGRGRAWPLLTGERGHYELAAGCDVRPSSPPWSISRRPRGCSPNRSGTPKTYRGRACSSGGRPAPRYHSCGPMPSTSSFSARGRTGGSSIAFRRWQNGIKGAVLGSR